MFGLHLRHHVLHEANKSIELHKQALSTYTYTTTTTKHWVKWCHRVGCTNGVTIRSPFCGYNTTQWAELKGKDLSCYSNKIESFGLRKCPYDLRLTNKAYLNAITVTNISTFLRVLPTRWQQKSTGIDMERLLCHCHPVYTRLMASFPGQAG